MAAEDDPSTLLEPARGTTALDRWLLLGSMGDSGPDTSSKSATPLARKIRGVFGPHSLDETILCSV